MSAAAEQKVKKLARLPANVICANCGTSKKFGHSTVCIKFYTFVCSNCKSSHQAISHRCKSLTMSSWTDAEVAELEAKGNDYARNTWLKNAPPIGTGCRPKEGDHIDVFKRFVVDVYEHKKYYGEYAGTASQHIATAIPLSQPCPAPVAQFAIPAVAVPAPRVPPPTPTIDLLDFATAPVAPAPVSFQTDFDVFGSSFAPATASSTPFQADFAAFQPPAAGPTGDGSAFGFISQSTLPVPNPAPESSGFTFISKPPAAAPAPSLNNDFADFARLAISAPSPILPPAPMEAKKPVMSANQKGTLISSMDHLTSPSQPQMTFGGMMPQQGGFGGMNSNNMMPQQGGFGGINGNNMMPQQGGFGGMNGTNMMQQQQMMLQQRQRMMMQQQGMSGMNTSVAMMNPGMMNGGMGIAMMTPQNMMNVGGQSNVGANSSSALNSLSMSGMDMSAWTTGKK